jgi:toxin secretion/phage lysis holin
VENIWGELVKGAGAALAALLGLLGGWDVSLQALLLFMSIDYALGIVCALSGKSEKTENGAFSSKACFEGLKKKMFILCMLAVAVMLDRLTGADGICRLSVAGYYIASEGLSILETGAQMGSSPPKALVRMLEVLKHKQDDEG